MPGVLTIAAETATTSAFHAEGTATLLLVAFMVAMGLLMGLVAATQIAKEWSR